jgi:hypothetical protein
MGIQKPVKEFLRAADIVLDRLKNGHPFSEQEVMMLQAYNARIAAYLGNHAVNETQVK